MKKKIYFSALFLLINSIFISGKVSASESLFIPTTGVLQKILLTLSVIIILELMAVTIVFFVTHAIRIYSLARIALYTLSSCAAALLCSLVGLFAVMAVMIVVQFEYGSVTKLIVAGIISAIIIFLVNGKVARFFFRNGNVKIGILGLLTAVFVNPVTILYLFEGFNKLLK